MVHVQSSNFWEAFFIGGITGATAQTINAPLERIKLLLQTQDSNSQLTGKKYKGIIDCFSRIYKEEGFRAYWKGNGVSVLRYFSTMSLNFGFKNYYKE